MDILNEGIIEDLEGTLGGDIITNDGLVEDDIIGSAGGDTIINNGEVLDEIFGDRSFPNDINGSGDLITNSETGIVNDDIHGGGGDDFITNEGFVGDEVLGEDGDDLIVNQLTGVIGDDVEGHDGNDMIVNYGLVEDDIRGGDGNDIIYNFGTVLDDVFNLSGHGIIHNFGVVEGDVGTGDGNDTVINSGEVGDDIYTSYGDDIIVLEGQGSVADTINGGAGFDTLSLLTLSSGVNFQAGVDIFEIENIVGTSFNDSITGDFNDTTINGGNGDDILIGSAGAYTPLDVVTVQGEITNTVDEFGETGTTVSFINFSVATDSVVTIDVLSFGLDVDGDGLVSDLNSHLRVFDSFGNSIWSASSGPNGSNDGSISRLDSFATPVFTQDGSETTTLAAGDYILTIGQFLTSTTEALNGFTARESIESDGDFQITFTGVDFVEGGVAGVQIDPDVSDNDTLNGGNGNDTLIGNFGDDALMGGRGDDTANGGDDNDTIIGGAGDDNLFGDAGDDIINGNSGADFINGGLGVDTVNGGGGNDRINGDDGNDTLSGGAGEDLIRGGNGDDVIFGNAQNDTLIGNGGADTISGGAGNDSLVGGGGNDSLIGNAGSDELLGGAGSDMLFGNAGGDDLFGGAGNDILSGGGGNDDLNGGGGADIFVFTGPIGVDRVQDFEDGTDLLDFSGFALVDSFADAIAAATQVGANVRFDFNANNVVVLESVTLDELDASDFIFDAMA